MGPFMIKSVDPGYHRPTIYCTYMSCRAMIFFTNKEQFLLIGIPSVYYILGQLPYFVKSDFVYHKGKNFEDDSNIACHLIFQKLQPLAHCFSANNMFKLLIHGSYS